MAAPPVDPAWEDVVEATWDAGRGGHRIVSLMGEEASAVDVPPGIYRVRYCVTGMDAGHAADVRRADEPAVDRYLVQLWPSRPGDATEDVVVTQGSTSAGYRHGVARALPSRAETRRTRAEQAQRRRRERNLEDVEARERTRRHAEETFWGGPRPDAPLGDLVEGAAIARLDRPPAVALAGAGPDEQRRVARWLLRRGLGEAGLDRIEWLVDAVDALDRGDPLPALFTDDHGAAATRRLFDDERVAHTVVRSLSGDIDNYSGQVGAVCGVRPAADPHTSRAVFGVLGEVVTVFGHDRYRALSPSCAGPSRFSARPDPGRSRRVGSETARRAPTM